MPRVLELIAGVYQRCVLSTLLSHWTKGSVPLNGGQHTVATAEIRQEVKRRGKNNIVSTNGAGNTWFRTTFRSDLVFPLPTRLSADGREIISRKGE